MIGVDNRTGPHPSLAVRDVQRTHDLLERGATISQVAEVMQVSKRTVYRYRDARLVRQRIAGYPLVFLLYPGRRPVLIEGRARR